MLQGYNIAGTAAVKTGW